MIERSTWESINKLSVCVGWDTGNESVVLSAVGMVAGKLEKERESWTLTNYRIIIIRMNLKILK